MQHANTVGEAAGATVKASYIIVYSATEFPAGRFKATLVAVIFDSTFARVLEPSNIVWER